MSKTSCDEMDCKFLRAESVYLNEGKTVWPYVNSARAISETNLRVADRMEELRAALEAQIEVSTSLMKRLDFSPQDILDCTSQARRALGADLGMTPLSSALPAGDSK